MAERIRRWLRAWLDVRPCPCRRRTIMASVDVDITVSTLPPIIDGPWTTDPMTCPHGVTYWIEPTGEQTAAWAAAGTP